MQEEYLERFSNFVKKSQRGKSNSKEVERENFKRSMEEVQDTNMALIDLDETKNTPLPSWARQIVEAKKMSKRTKLLLLKFHNLRIIAYRKSLATPKERNVKIDDDTMYED